MDLHCIDPLRPSRRPPLRRPPSSIALTSIASTPSSITPTSFPDRHLHRADLLHCDVGSAAPSRRTTATWRQRLKYFNNKPYEEALQNPPPRVQPSEWHDACEYWSKDETKTRSNVNYKNRTIAPSQTHALGLRSIDSLQARYENSNNGARMDRVAVFEATHSKVGEDGIRHWIHPNYEQLHGRIMELILPIQDEGGSSCSPMDREEVFRAVMPSEHDGFVHCVGRSVTKTSWYGRQGSQNSYVEKLEEQFRQNKEELFDIKLQMKEQTAKLREELHQQSQNIQKTREEMQQERQQMHDHMQYQSQMMDKLMSILQAPPTNCSRRTRSSRRDDHNLGDGSHGFAT